ncbi:uncharacterized protein [Fopius arisanus]|uniref:tRNA (uracil(54)-C(5))-methyltransferase n=1 Tax=Fopius arisanus TaxID=64838 RepID=A0A0C9QK37_9HYME|nr:PREDICTED: uncharacterized protein LOC105270660 [Fopius arisanus]
MSVIDDSEAITFEVEDFQVLDECVGEEDTPPNDDNQQQEEYNDKMDDPEEIDFTADLGLDNLNDQDVMEHLNEIENIVLDAKSFGLEPSEDDKPSVTTDDCPDIILLEPDKSDDPAISEAGDDDKKEEKPIDPEHQWYEEKLTAKVETVKDRLAKLSRVLEYSYPCYKDYLQLQAKRNSTAVCKLDPPRRCPLDRPHTNRWKFICTRKPLEETGDSTEEIKDENSIGKIVKTAWRLAASGDSVSNANAFKTNPPFVMHAVKIFEDFINTETTNEDEISAVDDKGLNDERETWLWLLVRSNSNDELMLFATGKEISQGRMEELKAIYEDGEGKECKVKSLYCKTTSKVDGIVVPQTIFLSGAEALDETVGDLKIQLAPKTNFWSNTTGAEQLGRAVKDLLDPRADTTVIEIGCGLGLICLMLAAQCERVIGVDSQSEIEEAEMTCDLNKIKNATFIMGDSPETMSKLSKTVLNRKSCAVINGNTSVARKIDVIWGLRKIPSLRRVVMVTTLAKQSIRSILELINPSIPALGRPFVPIKAVVVDTLPTGQHFEVVILMERRPASSLIHPKPDRNPNAGKNDRNSTVKSDRTVNASKQDRTKSETSPRPSKSTSNTPKALATSKGVASMKRQPPRRSLPDKTLVKNPFHEKTSPRPSPKPTTKSYKSPHLRDPPPRSARPPKSILKKPVKRSHNECEVFKISVPTKHPRPSIDPNDLRSRLTHNRSEPDLAHQVREQQRILEAAKEKLATSVDPATARQLQEILNLALEQTSNMQNQLPRSVWDRIAPPEGSIMDNRSPSDVPLKGSFVQERGGQDIVITTPNAKFNERKYEGIPPASPNQLMPSGYFAVADRRDRRDKPYDRGDKWATRGRSPRRIGDRVSPRRSPPRRGLSPPRRGPSPPRRNYSPGVRRRTPPRAQMSPIRRSPPRRQLSPPRRGPSPPRRQMSPPRRDIRDFEGQRRSLGSMGPAMASMEQMEVMRRQLSPPRRGMSPPRRQMSPPRMMPSSPRRQLPTTVTPMFGDDWDIPSRGAIEQQNNWQRQSDRERAPNSGWNFGMSEGVRGGGPMERGMGVAPGGRGEDNWSGKQSLSENRWSAGGGPPGDNNWGNRGKEGFIGGAKGWEGGKEDWNDLPEDARDPWDDGGNKDRWQGPAAQNPVWSLPGGSGGQRWSQGQGGQGAQWGQRPGGFSGGFPSRSFGGFNDGR